MKITTQLVPAGLHSTMGRSSSYKSSPETRIRSLLLLLLLTLSHLHHKGQRQHVAAFSLQDHSITFTPFLARRPGTSYRYMASGDDSGEHPPHKKKREPRITNSTAAPPSQELELIARITQLEQIVAQQAVELRKLRKECNELTEATVAFAKVVEILRQAGLETASKSGTGKSGNKLSDDHDGDDEGELKERVPEIIQLESANYEYFDDTEIFGRAPSSVIDAADAAGAAILAGMLGGKQRMLVDVRDADLSRDPDVLVQFLELAILPVAAGLEGLKSTRNRVKIVFPTVSQLLQYRRTMALAAPEVVALSTLGFDPVESKDQLVVLVAPAPDDEEGLAAMNELLEPTDPSVEPISQPLVVINHHMVPVSGPVKHFEVAYHLRLLSVQYMSGDNAPDYLKAYEEYKRESGGGGDSVEAPMDEDEALEAAMKHAHEIGAHQGVTRAMVIRAYPKPWHVFVDTSPDTDADFEVAATFDEEPTQDDVNFAIVECLEGSDREDELVAQQMQQALEAGQLDRVADMLGMSAIEIDDDEQQKGLGRADIKKSSDEEGSNFYNDFDIFEDEDSC